MVLRKEAKQAIDSAISQSAQPKSNRTGVGLVLPIPNARQRTLFDKKGITEAGKYYYQKSGLPEPQGFDYNQDSVRKGRSQYINTLEGSQKRISTWDPVAKTWKLTALGKKFYEKQIQKSIKLQAQSTANH